MRQDICFALRMLRRERSVSVPAVLVMALGLGSAAALYAVVYTMWLKPLSYPDSGRLVSVTTYFPSYKLDVLTSPDFGAWQGTRSLGPLGAYSTGTATMIGPDETVEVACARVSGNLLGILRVHAASGRNIQPADDGPEAPRVAMISDSLWREQYHGDPRMVGRTARIDREAYLIVGILPRGFRMPAVPRVDLLVPLALGEGWLRHGGSMKILHGVARLKPGVTLAQATAELSICFAASRAQAPQVYGEGATPRIVPLQDFVTRSARTIGIVLAGAVLAILLIASANVAGLLVARAAGRRREITIRIALGANAVQIGRLLLIEGLVIGTIGIVSGLGIARLLIGVMPRLRYVMLSRIEGASLNSDVLLAAIAAGVLCSMAFSLAPLLPVSRLRLRRGLVVGELALSLILVVAATLLLQNLRALNTVAPGFRTQRLATASIPLKGTTFAEDSAGLRRQLVERLQRAPGVAAIGFADALPPSGAGRVSPFSRADRPLPAPFDGRDNVIVCRVDAGFFEVMRIPLRNGRLFTETDTAGEGLVAIVNRTLAERYFAGESPIGKSIDGGGIPWKNVIGVVADTRNDGLRNPPRPEIYLPLTSKKSEGGGITQEQSLQVVISTDRDPEPVSRLLRESLRAIDPGLFARVRMMDEQWQELWAGPRFQTILFSGFAVLALMMACAGVYGVQSYLVVLRRREIGIRMALGARPAGIQYLVVREAVLLAAGGVVFGTAGAWAAARIIANLLYQVNARDPFTLAATAALLVLLAVGASIVPAVRASREDPARTLRAE